MRHAHWHEGTSWSIKQRDTSQSGAGHVGLLANGIRACWWGRQSSRRDMCERAWNRHPHSTSCPYCCPRKKEKRLSLVYGVLHLSLKAGVYALPTSACQRTVRTPEERLLFWRELWGKLMGGEEEEWGEDANTFLLSIWPASSRLSPSRGGEEGGGGQ